MVANPYLGCQSAPCLVHRLSCESPFLGALEQESLPTALKLSFLLAEYVSDAPILGGALGDAVEGGRGAAMFSLVALLDSAPDRRTGAKRPARTILWQRLV